MEPKIIIVAVSAVVGVLPGLWLLKDAHTDRQLYHMEFKGKTGDETANRITRNRLVSESIRFLLQLAFFTVAVIFAVETNEFLEDAAVWVLVAMPIVLAAWSLYSWWDRKTILGDVIEPTESE